MTLFGRRFATEALGRVDWPPLVEFSGPFSVRIYAVPYASVER
jgi:hypothetical protein